MLKHWETLSSERILQTPWFEIRKDACRTAEGHLIPEYYTWNKRDCVIIFPLTEDRRVILIRQYRHGLKKVCVDYPGGTVDKGSTVLASARQELIEETGYDAKDFELIGSYAMDSSYSNQMAHFVVAGRCERASVPDHPQEVTEIMKIPLNELGNFANKHIECVLCSLLTVKAVAYLSVQEV